MHGFPCRQRWNAGANSPASAADTRKTTSVPALPKFAFELADIDRGIESERIHTRVEQ
jgi:hypothetical protein